MALSVDVEGFAESHAESVRIPSDELRPERCDAEIARNLDVVLPLLAQYGCRGTFFFLGRIGRSAPELVRQVAGAGHEIGCHSLYHRRITGQSVGEFRENVRAAKADLEDAGGQAVVGFRAPEFSIVHCNRWALDELLSAGFVYDSSVVSMNVRDVCGMSETSRAVFRWPNGLVEFPLPVVRFGPVSLPIGGGGYFRLYPLSWTRWFFRHRARRGLPTVFYVHPYEVGPQAPRLPGLSAMRRFRHYVRLGRGRERMARLLAGVAFTTMAEVLAEAGFYHLTTDGATE